MMSRWRTFLAVAALGVAAAGCASAPKSSCVPYEGLDPQCLIERGLLAEALASYRRHKPNVRPGEVVGVMPNGTQIPFYQRAMRSDKLTIIDYRKPAYERRLYIVDMATGAVAAHHVSHGRGSALSERSFAAGRFTNVLGSGTTSVGAYVGGQTYDSAKWGYALRLRGLDHTNYRALERTIVIHADARYFDVQRALYGWSCGCFMTDATVNPVLINAVRDGGFLYAGPAVLHDTTSTQTAQECNPNCGEGNNCTLVAGADSVGSLPQADAPPGEAGGFLEENGVRIPNPQQGETPVPARKPAAIGPMAELRR